MSKHTAEPWHCKPHTPMSGPGGPHDWTILGDTHEEFGDEADIGGSILVSTVVAKVLGNATAGGIPEANARRIVACVNACDGLNPEALPALIATAEDMLNNWTNVKARDALRSILNNVLAK